MPAARSSRMSASRTAKAPNWRPTPRPPPGARSQHWEACDPIVVHFDVDVVDSGDLPLLGNFPHYASGVRLDDVTAAPAGAARPILPAPGWS